jgi:hypothetical protein
MQTNKTSLRILLSMVVALALLGIFIGWNYHIHEQSLKPAKDEVRQKESLPDTAGMKSKCLARHDFESGSASDTATHLAAMGYKGKQSLKMSSRVSFSPGLWIKLRELKPGDSTWIRVTGYVWFSCPVAEAKSSLVATCNRNGINYKYMFIPLEKEALKPNRWNKITIDYHVPEVTNQEDVLQAYFWYRGNGEMLVDEIEIWVYTRTR